LPHRLECVEKAAAHLELIEQANQHFNLTRIIDPRQAVIKHVLDSLMPWRLFAGARHVADAGTGAGYPGMVLALVLPDVRFTLIESTQKKARFVEAAAVVLGIENVRVAAERAEYWLKSHRPDVVTARAVAPLDRALGLFAHAANNGAKCLFYKGPDVE